MCVNGCTRNDCVCLFCAVCVFNPRRACVRVTVVVLCVCVSVHGSNLLVAQLYMTNWSY